MTSRSLPRRAFLGVFGAPLAAAVAGCGGRQVKESEERQVPAPHVANEHGRLRAAIVHDGRNAVDVTMDDYHRLVPADELRDHPESGPSSKQRLAAQHASFRDLLAGHGVELFLPDTRAGAFCQVFTRDPSFVVGDTFFVGGLRDPWRHPETAGLAPVRARLERVADLSGEGATIEGGDVMVLAPGSRVLVGMNRHTNEAGVRKLSDALAASGAEVIKIPHHALHLDCCLAPLPNGEALYAPEKLPPPSLAVLAKYFHRLHPLDREESALHLAANIFWLDERTAVSGTAARKTNDLLRAMEFEVAEIDFSDLVSLWGSFRCVVCPLVRG